VGAAAVGFRTDGTMTAMRNGADGFLRADFPANCEGFDEPLRPRRGGGEAQVLRPRMGLSQPGTGAVKGRGALSGIANEAEVGPAGSELGFRVGRSWGMGAATMAGGDGGGGAGQVGHDFETRNN